MKILRLEDFISLQNCLFVYDFLKNKLPTCFNRYFQTVKSVHDINTKSSRLGCLFIPHVSTHTYGLNSITRKSITSWNYFSKLFKSNLSELSRSMLKNKLTSHFLASYQFDVLYYLLLCLTRCLILFFILSTYLYLYVRPCHAPHFFDHHFPQFCSFLYSIVILVDFNVLGECSQIRLLYVHFPLTISIGTITLLSSLYL